MLLTNLILSSLITFNSSAPVNSFSSASKLNENLILNNIVAIHFIYQDIFFYTKPHMSKIIRVTTNNIDQNTLMIRTYRAKEINPVAELFTKNNMYHLLFVGAIGSIYLGQNFLMELDPSGRMANLFIIAVNIAEYFAIKSWTDSFDLTPIEFHIPIVTYTF